MAFGCVAILVACVDDSIAAGTLTVDDNCAAALDNDYLSDQPTTPQRVERQLHLDPQFGSTVTSLQIPRRVVAVLVAHFRFEPRDVFPLIMRC